MHLCIDPSLRDRLDRVFSEECATRKRPSLAYGNIMFLNSTSTIILSDMTPHVGQ